MSQEIINSLEILKNFVIEASSLIESKDKKINELEEKCQTLEDDYKNLKKVSLVTSLSKQVDNKNNQIQLLQKQLDRAKSDLINFKESSKKLSKITKIETLQEDSDDELSYQDHSIEIEPGYQMIEHEDIKLLKNLETRKLYYLINGKKGKYAGKESKKGKIKLK